MGWGLIYPTIHRRGGKFTLIYLDYFATLAKKLSDSSPNHNKRLKGHLQQNIRNRDESRLAISVLVSKKVARTVPKEYFVTVSRRLISIGEKLLTTTGKN